MGMIRNNNNYRSNRTTGEELVRSSDKAKFDCDNTNENNHEGETIAKCIE